MNILVLSDMHGETGNIEILAEEFARADMVLFGGDFAQFEHEETGKPALETLLKKHEYVYAVTGNCDNPDFLDVLENEDCSVQGSLVFHDGVVLCGSGGGSKFTGTTPNERSEEELVSDFDIVLNSAAEGADSEGHWSNLVLIMHNPPKDTKCDMIEGGIHVGSQMLRDFIVQTEPFLVVTGHIHESAGIDKIGKTTVINPGSLAEGKYGWVVCDCKDGEWTVSDCQLKSVK